MKMGSKAPLLQEDWENPRVTSINRCEAHVPLRAHSSAEDALRYWREDAARVAPLAQEISEICAGKSQVLGDGEYSVASRSVGDLLPKRGLPNAHESSAAAANVNEATRDNVICLNGTWEFLLVPSPSLLMLALSS